MIERYFERQEKLTVVLSWIYFTNDDVDVAVFLFGNNMFCSIGMTFINFEVSIICCSLCGSCQAKNNIYK